MTNKNHVLYLAKNERKIFQKKNTKPQAAQIDPPTLGPTFSKQMPHLG